VIVEDSAPAHPFAFPVSPVSELLAVDGREALRDARG
jgi:hypothetical protein